MTNANGSKGIQPTRELILKAFAVATTALDVAETPEDIWRNIEFLSNGDQQVADRAVMLIMASSFRLWNSEIVNKFLNIGMEAEAEGKRQ